MRQHIEVLSADGHTALAADIREIPGPHVGTLIFSHGFCLDRHSWAVQAQRLSWMFPGLRTVVYDHRGHGDSGRAGLADCTIESLAADLGAVVAATAHGPVTLAGHSMGGMTALAYLGTVDPETISGLALVATSSGEMTGHGIGRLLALPGVEQAPRLAALVPRALLEHACAHLTSPVLHAAMRMGLCYRTDPGDCDKTATCWALNATSAVTKIGFLPALKRFDARAVLPRITARTVVVSGGEDQLTPLPHSELLVSSIAGARHLHFPSSGHMVHHEEPDALTGVLAELVTPAPVRAEERELTPR